VEKILGYKPEEIVGVKHFYELFHPEDRKKPRKMAFAVFAKKKPFREFINRNIHKNGKTVWLSTSGMPILDEKGKLLGYRGADTDITERKRAEKIQLVLYNIANAVNKTEDLNELFKSIQNQLGTIIDTTNFYIALYNKENDTLSLHFHISWMKDINSG
jgi:PAS domain S-box-containing protein